MIEYQDIGSRFTEMVDLLKRNPNPKLAMLGKLTWRLVGNKIINVAVVEAATSLSFAVMKSKKDELIRGIAVCPTNWIQQISDNSFYCMGGLVFVCSQCRDFWNGKFNYDGDNSSVIERAIAYEAEFLKDFERIKSLNEYQKKVLNRYPKGLNSVPNLIYSGKNYIDAN